MIQSAMSKCFCLAFGSVVAVVIFVIAAIVILKHVQIRRREFDKGELSSLFSCDKHVTQLLP